MSQIKLFDLTFAKIVLGNLICGQPFQKYPVTVKMFVVISLLFSIENSC